MEYQKFNKYKCYILKLFIFKIFTRYFLWNTNNVNNMSYMFWNCSSLKYLPDISKWNIDNVTDMSNMFLNFSSLKYLPDISKWNTNNVKNMSLIFCNCSSLKYLVVNVGTNTKKYNKSFYDL